jgi:hypothetical protein
MNTLSAIETAAIVNDAIGEATNEEEQIEKAQITAPFNGLIDLPGGFVTMDGEVIRTAEVRELTGRDEELISKASNFEKAFGVILQRGLVSVGSLPVNDKLLDSLLQGDRDAILLGIYRATFGDTAVLNGYNAATSEITEVEINLVEDIEIKELNNPLKDRTFIVKGRSKEYEVTLPTGVTHKQILSNYDKTVSELLTIVLENCVLSIDGVSVISKEQVYAISVSDRRKINSAIADHNPGPQFENVKVPTPDGEGEVVVPISLGALFQF